LVRPRFVISAIARSIWDSQVSTLASACNCASARASGRATLHSQAWPLNRNRNRHRNHGPRRAHLPGVDPCLLLRLPPRRPRRRQVALRGGSGSSSPDSCCAGRMAMTAELGRVEMWRGGCRSNISVAAPFVWRCLSGSTLTSFPHPAHRTGRADPLRPVASHVDLLGDCQGVIDLEVRGTMSRCG